MSPKRAAGPLAEAFVTYQQRINELGYALVFSAVLEDALVYVRGMIDWVC